MKTVEKIEQKPIRIDALKIDIQDLNQHIKIVKIGDIAISKSFLQRIIDTIEREVIVSPKQLAERFKIDIAIAEKT